MSEANALEAIADGAEALWILRMIAAVDGIQVVRHDSGLIGARITAEIYISPEQADLLEGLIAETEE